VPQIALALLGAWAVVLTLSGSFNPLSNYTTVGEWLGHVFGIGALFWYRKHFIDQPAPYQVRSTRCCR
jgi:APA family basic amino acid/polyamine antiporter